MGYLRTIGVLILLGSCFCLAGCYQLFFKRQDMENVRRQFHLPRGVKFVSFESYPKTAGFFGREGLRIAATVKFSDQLFNEYITHLEDKDLWKPVSFLAYSPNSATEYSRESLSWKDLPISEAVFTRCQSWRLCPETIQIVRGKHYCSVVFAERGEPLKNTPGGFNWKYVGRACSELTDSDYPTIGTSGFLDYDKKLLYVRIQFSG